MATVLEITYREYVPWKEARCLNGPCGHQGSGHGRLLFRYTTDCLTAGGEIEIKCPRCNAVTRITDHKL